LTGDEIIEAIADRLKAKLRSYGYPLRPGDCYEWFKADIPFITVEMLDAGTVQKAEYGVHLEHGEAPAEGTEVVKLETSLEISKAEPNRVREETGQPIPTLTQDEKGRSVIKGVRYQKK
jgi:hypothetical protein